MLVKSPPGLRQSADCLSFANVKWIIRKFRRAGKPLAQLGPSQRLGMGSLATRAVHGLIEATYSEGFVTVSRQHFEGPRSTRLWHPQALGSRWKSQHRPICFRPAFIFGLFSFFPRQAIAPSFSVRS